MASQMVDSTTQKPAVAEPRQKVRIVGKIRPFTDSEIDSSQGLPAARVVVQKPTGDSFDHVTLLIGDQTYSPKEPYKLDYCYDQEEDTEKIYSREVKPLLSEIFQGFNAAVLAYGARGSGKTHIIQGSNEKPGLASLALAEILSKGKEIGSSVSVSFYEIYQDHVYDLLQPKQEVFILEKTGGKIQLRGLSQVPINSLSDFNVLYLDECNQRKTAEKHLNDARWRTHKGLIIQMSSNKKSANNTVIGKMTFIDLAGYEDAKRLAKDNPHLVDGAKINNKSLYALQNVVYALNAKEKRVPFREAKLTRILQDSMDGNNKALMITCVNPTLCPDTIHAISVSSRSCHAMNWTCRDTGKKINSKASNSTSDGSQTLLAKKTQSSKLLSDDKRTNYAPSAKKGERKLFGTANRTPKYTKIQETPSAAPASESMQEKCLSNSSKAVMEPVSVKEETSSHVSLALGTSTTAEVNRNLQEEESTYIAVKAIESLTPQVDVFPLADHVDSNKIGGYPKLSDVSQDCSMLNENKWSPISRPSPPISARLREITNTLKSLSSTPVPIYIKTPIAGNTYHSQVSKEPIEPKTPSIPFNVGVEENLELATAATPREVFEARSCGLKKSLVKEYLKYLNSASKEELKALKGIGEKRAGYILELREESPEPFKSLEDLREVGLSAKQANRMMQKAAEALFI
ncbi:kinesin-like protein KIN-10C isoform X2 [Aristolochia californica]|uniref:kinesin-like protein KIN-10C isoform X2 n=1 Tax=Aristolochia californica TaxID=171875 RepID=UPI0035E3161D